MSSHQTTLSGGAHGQESVAAEFVSGGPARDAARAEADRVMAQVLLDAMARDELVLATQPIRNRAGETLYEECLLRFARQDATNNVARSPAAGIAALERLGLVRRLDQFVLLRAIALLGERSDLRLGVNISAQSAMLDSWWGPVLDRLADRDVAERLTIEITETSLLPSLPAAVAFTARLRELGCRVALDDFGAGREAIRNLWGLRPDIVKIDAFFLHQARRNPEGLAALRGLVGLAAALGNTLVIEGVESDTDAALAHQAGVAWLQVFTSRRLCCATPLSSRRPGLCLAGDPAARHPLARTSGVLLYCSFPPAWRPSRQAGASSPRSPSS